MVNSLEILRKSLSLRHSDAPNVAGRHNTKSYTQSFMYKINIIAITMVTVFSNVTASYAAGPEQGSVRQYEDMISADQNGNASFKYLFDAGSKLHQSYDSWLEITINNNYKMETSRNDETWPRIGDTKFREMGKIKAFTEFRNKTAYLPVILPSHRLYVGFGVSEPQTLVLREHMPKQ